MIIYQGFLGGGMVFDKGAGVKPMELQMQKEGESPGSHDHSNSGGHEHSNSQDTSSSKTNQPASGHDHKNEQDTTSSQTVSEKKKELKGMKY